MDKGMLKAALHHHFPKHSNHSLLFSKLNPVETSLELAFTDELVGLDAKISLY
jgi:hypothetical protein